MLFQGVDNSPILTYIIKKKQNDMIKLLKKELRKYGYSVRVAN